LSTIAKLARPGGVHAVVAESLVRRAPNLNSFDRFILALGSLFVSPSRIPKLAVILKPRTLLRFHEALKKRISAPRLPPPVRHVHFVVHRQSNLQRDETLCCWLRNVVRVPQPHPES